MNRALLSRRKAGFVLLVLVALAIASAVVMALWNALLPMLFGWHRLDYLQALGLLVLCRVLFGGRGGPFGGPPGGPWDRRRWEAAWQRMTPEEREALCARWKKFGGPPFGGPPFGNPSWERPNPNPGPGASPGGPAGPA